MCIRDRVSLPVMPPEFWVASTKPEPPRDRGPEAGMYCWMGHLAILRHEHEEHVQGRKVRERSDLYGLVDVHVRLPDARDHPDRDVARIEGGQPGRTAPGGDDQIALLD